MFNLFFYKPLYNGLIFLIGVMPWADIGIVVILFTCLVKLALFPLSKKSVLTQIKIKEIQPELDGIKEKYKNNKQEQALKVMALYKNKKVNPFSGILLIFIQIPIIFALYFVFLKGGLPKINTNLLYPFIKVPQSINVSFLKFLDITQKSYAMSFFAAATQFFQVKFAGPQVKKGGDNPNTNSFKDDLAKSMSIQMKYILPVIIFFIAKGLPAVVALYWTTSNLFTIGQELYLRRSRKNLKPETVR
ncbi:MAG: YidC/Oxa1 family membrane protein insertase [Patescibacteria group bacterium]|nr:membrane protein insertase YidC [Patescibacteria group bacterium]MDE2218023.1 YidC/Oxa1 family membrane protein insertase [Patescibacteria group bacterium]